MSRIGVAAAARGEGRGRAVERVRGGEAPAEVVEMVDSVGLSNRGADDRSSVSEAGTARAPGRVDASGDEVVDGGRGAVGGREPAEAADSRPRPPER